MNTPEKVLSAQCSVLSDLLINHWHKTGSRDCGLFILAQMTKHAEPVRSIELADEMKLTQCAVNAILRRYRALGFVEAVPRHARPKAAANRQRWWFLTPTGQALFQN